MGALGVEGPRFGRGRMAPSGCLRPVVNNGSTSASDPIAELESFSSIRT